MLTRRQTTCICLILAANMLTIFFAINQNFCQTSTNFAATGFFKNMDWDIMSFNNDDTEGTEIYDPLCECDRKIFQFEKSFSVSDKRSLCGYSATMRGKSQRVISYSMYGTPLVQRKWLEHLLVNLAAVKKYYPEYSMRLYLNGDFHQPRELLRNICHLSCHNEHFDICPIDDLELLDGR